MQTTNPLVTGHEDGAGRVTTGQAIHDDAQADHDAQQSYHQIEQIAAIEQHEGSIRSPEVDTEIFAQTLNLNANQSTVLSNVIAAADPMVLASIIHVSVDNEQNFRAFRNLSRLRKTRPKTMIHLAYGLTVITEPSWSLLSSLGADGRQVLASHILHRYPTLRGMHGLGLGDLPMFFDMNPDNALAAPTPASPGQSSTCPSSASSKNRMSAGKRWFCPASDCEHKLEGFARPGYLRNHVRITHPSMVEEDSDWEAKVVARGPDDETPNRRRSNKRSATPSTPGAQRRKTGHLVIETGRTVPNGNYSPGTLFDDLEEPSPPVQHTITRNHNDARPVPEVKFFSPSDAHKLQLPPTIHSPYPVNPWTAHVAPGGQPYICTDSSLSGGVTQTGYGRPFEWHPGQLPDLGHRRPTNGRG